MSAAHTPTPWHYAAKQYAGLGIAHSEDGALKPAARTGGITGRSKLDGGEGWHYIAAMNSHTESDADAAFIVRACNAHDELVAALEAIIKESGVKQFDDDDEPTGTITKMAHIAHAALAKVQA